MLDHVRCWTEMKMRLDMSKTSVCTNPALLLGLSLAKMTATHLEYGRWKKSGTLEPGGVGSLSNVFCLFFLYGPAW